MSICDASPSWSGYQYQGKVSIYIVLKMINDFIENGIYEEYKNYSIEIEHREDFSIKHNGDYKSIHQVKARMDDTTINPYLEAMGKLNKDKSELPSLNLYLHTICCITDWNLDGYKKCLNTKITNLYKKLEKCENDSQKLKVIEEIEFFNKILNDESFFSNINLYQYSNGNYHCSLDEIRDLIRDEIQRYFILSDLEYKSGSVEIIYNQFIGFFDEYIKERHKKNIKLDIEFEEFKDRLDDDDILKKDENYYLYQTKERYLCNIHKYCEDICDKKEICSIDINNCKLVNLVNMIDEIDLSSFKKLIYKINPHVNISDWELDNSNLTDEKSIYFLCCILNDEIDKDYKIDKNTLLYKCDYNNSYIPTTITYIYPRIINKVAESYIRNIKNNEFLLNELFESNIFITENLNKQNILEDISDVEEIDEAKRLKDLELEDKLYLKNRVDFKDINLVKEELV
ncbi:hypothetical protein C4097_18210 [Clostridioides difficile]|nr:hypothetical protein [Clostridioides difficile]